MGLLGPMDLSDPVLEEVGVGETLHPVPPEGLLEGHTWLLGVLSAVSRRLRSSCTLC